MDNQARKEVPRTDADNYKPEDVSPALKLVHKRWSQASDQAETSRLQARLVTREAFHVAAIKAAGSMKHFELGKDVRRAWHELFAMMNPEPGLWNDREAGYVLCPQWNTGRCDNRLELWVGVPISSAERIPAGARLLHMPARTYATVVCRGDRDHMNRAYGYIQEWMRAEGHEADDAEGVFGMEPNRLSPVNPFDIPADEIERFDFDIMIAIKS